MDKKHNFSILSFLRSFDRFKAKGDIITMGRSVPVQIKTKFFVEGKTL